MTSRPTQGACPPRVMLVFPPVWVPMVPHLALPALAAYLREKGHEVRTVDANISFFVDYLLTPETLCALAPRAARLLDGSAGADVPRGWLDLARRELPRWEASVSRVDRILRTFRDPELFFQPDALLGAQDELHGLMLLASLAQWPGRISFNHYRRGDIRTFEDLLGLCDDPERNAFLPFWRDHVLPDIVEDPPPLVGISISSVHQFIAAMTLARLIRNRLPRVHVVVGGKHLLRIREKLLGHPQYFRWFFHSAVLHEGEEALEALLMAVTRAQPLSRVPNLISLEEGRPRATFLAPPPRLQDLPPADMTDAPWGRYLVPRPYAPVRMSQGCYWGKCTFCIRYGHERVDYLPPERVVEDLERLQDVHGVRDISVNDDCMPPAYWEDLCARILKRRLSLSMLIWAKPVAGFTPRRLRRMAQAGVRQIRWGVESTHPRVLKLMRKGTSPTGALGVLGAAHEAGIWNHACIIIGFPTETRQEAQATLDFLAANRSIVQSFILYPFVLYQNSHLFHEPRAFGITEIRVDDTPFFDQISFRTSRGMDPREVQALVRSAKETLLAETYGWPFWYYLKLREYLQLYLDRFGLERTARMSFDRRGLRRSWEGQGP